MRGQDIIILAQRHWHWQNTGSSSVVPIKAICLCISLCGLGLGLGLLLPCPCNRRNATGPASASTSSLSIYACRLEQGRGGCRPAEANGITGAVGATAICIQALRRSASASACGMQRADRRYPPRAATGTSTTIGTGASAKCSGQCRSRRRRIAPCAARCRARLAPLAACACRACNTSGKRRGALRPVPSRCRR